MGNDLTAPLLTGKPFQEVHEVECIIEKKEEMQKHKHGQGSTIELGLDVELGRQVFLKRDWCLGRLGPEKKKE